MKQRNGFVSNSSSSSFIMIGTKVDINEIPHDTNDDIDYNLLEDHNLTYVEHNGKYILGRMLYKWYEDDMVVDKLMTVSELYIEERDVFDILLHSFNMDKPLSLYYGSEYN